jgi:L,D-transpeptidase YcbB
MKMMRLVLIALIAGASSLPAQSSIADELQQSSERLSKTGSIVIAGAAIRNRLLLPRIYEIGGFAPLWTDSRAAGDLIRVIREVARDGLNPAHYNLAVIERLAAHPATPVNTAELDLLRTDALIRLAYDLRYGKVDPVTLEVPRDRARPLRTADAAADLRLMIRSGRLHDEVIALRPDHYGYRALLNALAQLRHIEQAGGWISIRPGRPLQRDSADARAPLLRQRLAMESDLSDDAALDDMNFDRTLQEGLQSFQHRHGLKADGLLGPATLAELNVPVETRMDQLKVNLERARWVMHDLPKTFVSVNVAGAMVYFIRDGKVIFETRGVVGRSYTATPVFRATMSYIELNPTWTVPPGIVGEVLAAIRRNPRYLAQEKMHVLSRNGRRLDEAGIDFSRYTARNFPYVFHQAPGPRNPLGRLKFVMPNSYNVYLHDTPSHELFEREQRTFSHGCIRVHEPLRLAALILNEFARWSPESIQAAIETGATRAIRLATPVPVLVLYWTASTDLHGELHFYRDVYGRDAALLRALDRR